MSAEEPVMPPQGSQEELEGAKNETTSFPQSSPPQMAGIKRFSVGAQMQKTSRPPSMLGKAVKLSLILIVILGIPCLIGASFIVKVGEKRQIPVAQKFWEMFRTLIGLRSNPKDRAKMETHPHVEAYDSIIRALERQKGEILAVERMALEHEEIRTWERENALVLHHRIDESSKKIGVMMEELNRLGQWIRDYGDLMEEASRAYDEGIGSDSRKQECVQFMIRGEPLPPGYEELAEDPGVLRYVQACKDLMLDRCLLAPLIEKNIDETLRDAHTMMKKIRQIRALLPSKDLSGERTDHDLPEKDIPPMPEQPSNNR